MKNLLLIFLFLTSICAFSQRQWRGRHHIKPSQHQYQIHAQDSVVANGRTTYFANRIDSFVIYKDKVDGEFHLYSDCSCIDDAISAHFIWDLNQSLVIKNFCPLCLAKAPYFVAMCDTIAVRKNRAAGNSK